MSIDPLGQLIANNQLMDDGMYSILGFSNAFLHCGIVAIALFQTESTRPITNSSQIKSLWTNSSPKPSRPNTKLTPQQPTPNQTRP